MPEPPDDFEHDLRGGLEDMAGESSPPPKAPPGVLTSARRRIARNAGALAVVLVVIAGGVAVGLSLTGGRGSAPVPIGSGNATSSPPTSGPATSSPPSTGPATSAPPSTSGPSTSGPSGPSTPTPSSSLGVWRGPDGTEMFVGGVVYEFATGAPQPVVAGTIPDDTAVRPPVATPHGVVVLGGRPGRFNHLWLLRPGGGTDILDEGRIDGFGVSAEGSRVAYAVVDERTHRSRLIERSLVTGSPTSQLLGIDTYVRVVGYAGDRVVLETGDGASATVSTWAQGETAIIQTDGYGTADAADPDSALAVLNQGDGPCWSVVRIAADGSANELRRGDECGVTGVSFEPGGETIAGVVLTSESPPGPQRLFLAGTHSRLGGETVVKGAFQTTWVRRGAFLALARDRARSYEVLACQVSENICPDPPVWVGTAPGTEGTVWLVEERPAA